MKKFEEFKKEIADRAQEELGGNILIHKENRNNGSVRESLLIVSEERNITPRINLNAFYNEYVQMIGYEEGAMDVIWSRIKDVYFENLPEHDFDTSFLTDFEKVKKRIRCRLVNYEMNKEMLRDRLYTTFLDLAVTYFVLLSAEGDTVIKCSVGKSFLERWGVSEEELYDIAVENIKEECSIERLSLENMMLPSLEKEVEDCSIIVMSNRYKIDGASSMLLSDVLNNFCDRVHKRYLAVLPSSIHEVMLLPCESTSQPELDCLDDMVRAVNEEEVGLEEILSNHVYVYDRKSGWIR